MTHCIHCGHTLPEQDPWPKVCIGCRRFNYCSPKPVIALVLHNGQGYLVIQRGIEPSKGQWAFPGGYIDHAEDWREAAVREAREELGIILDPDKIYLRDVVSTPNNFLVLFVGTHEKVPTDWIHHDISSTLNDTGEQEILSINVWDTYQPLGIRSHNEFFLKLDFAP